MTTEQQRTETIVKHLRIAKPYKNQVSDLIEQIRILGEDLGEVEPDPKTKARIYSELAGYFSQLAVRELT
jgi:hypothetical protein